MESLYNNPGTSISDISGNGTDFNTALENNLVWTTGGDAPWFTQSTTTYDGIDAAKSGMIGHDQYSWLETTVTGPGTLSFWWFVSSDDYDGYDRLEFSIDGNNENTISGEPQEWNFLEYELGPGAHTLQWAYYKDSDYTAGLDAGFLDQVNFIPGQSPMITAHPINQTNTPGYKVGLFAAASGVPEPTWQWYKIGTGLIPNANSALYVPANSGTPGAAGQYYAIASNSSGSAITHTATVTFVSAPLPPDWSRAFKSPNTHSGDSSEELYLASAVDADQNIYTVGSFTGTAIIGTNTYVSLDGDYSSLIVKQTATGTPIWARSVTNNGQGSSYTRQIALAPNNGIYISGTIFGTNWLGTNALVDIGGASLYIARLDAAGTVLWIKTLGGTNTVFNGFQQMVSDPAGNVTLSALFQGTVNLGTTNVTGPGQYGALVQYDSDGNLRWVQLPSNWIINLAYHDGRLYGTMGNNGTNYIGGLTNVSDRRWVLAALNATNGQPLWIQGVGTAIGEGNPLGVSDDYPQVTASGTNVFLVGNGWGASATFGPFTVSMPGSNAQYFARFANDGTPQLATAFGGASVFPWSIVADPAGNVYLGADFENVFQFGSNVLAAPKLDESFYGDYSHSFVAKFDRNGTPLWARQAQSESHYVNVRDLELAPDGVWYCGFVKSPAQFGTNWVYSSSEVIGSPFGYIVWHSSGVLAKITDGTSVAIPNPVQLVNVLKSGTNVAFSFLSQTGFSHTIESRTNLSLGTWQTRSNFPGDGNLKTFQFPATNRPAEFFRVKTQ
ncbi:MAG: hypothetical protein H7Y43_02765 [Akkermansiaceae bacterium]|nr:hypothetical protein [Verrucomicrobiales bacterium]